jgi:hypothetical protein
MRVGEFRKIDIGIRQRDKGRNLRRLMQHRQPIHLSVIMGPVGP